MTRRGSPRMETVGFIVVASAILGFGLVSRRAQSTPVTPPMVVAFGFVLGGRARGWVRFDIDAAWIDLVAEVTLMLILFTDASRIDLGLLRREHDLPVRLLRTGLPLTVLAGTAAAALLFPEIGLWSAVVLAGVLAPTDAALGQAVVGSRRVPEHEEVSEMPLRHPAPGPVS